MSDQFKLNEDFYLEKINFIIKKISEKYPLCFKFWKAQPIDFAHEQVTNMFEAIDSKNQKATEAILTYSENHLDKLGRVSRDAVEWIENEIRCGRKETLSKRLCDYDK